MVRSSERRESPSGRRHGRRRRRDTDDRSRERKREHGRGHSRSERNRSRSRSRDRKRRREAIEDGQTGSTMDKELETPQDGEAEVGKEGPPSNIANGDEERRKRMEAWLKKKKKMKEIMEKSKKSGAEEKTLGDDAAGSERMKEDGAPPPSLEVDKLPDENAQKQPSEEPQEGKAKEWNLEDDEEDGVEAPDIQESLLKLGADGGFRLPRLGELGRSKATPEDDDSLDKFVGTNIKNRIVNNPVHKGKGFSQSGMETDGGSNGTAMVKDAVADSVQQFEDDVDPLDAFMVDNVMPEVEKLKKIDEEVAKRVETEEAGREDEAKAEDDAGTNLKSRTSLLGPLYGVSDEEDEESMEEDDIEWAKKVQSGRISKADKLGVTDHSTIDYPSFRKDFYVEVPELARMTKAEVDAYRKELDGLKVRGQNVPKPIKHWTQAGLNARVLDSLRRAGFETPLPIQAQALPVVMSGRDCIGIAKTGSGKTLAFVLPMIRHIKDQEPLQTGDGPIALVMAPTRELVVQIHREVRRFTRTSGLSCTAVFGGSGIANQISELKRGSEIVVCTPGRMIDILATGNGRITNLRRVTYLVLDEADRMFDMGFEPQIMRMIINVRPDRQTVLFSATFPRTVESLARQALTNPVEIQLGGRSVVNPDITQIVELRPEEERFLRLLELLGEWYERGKTLIFVSSQDRCDGLFRDLLRAGYPCLSLHGGKDQADRASTISDFKSDVCNVLIATSVAARGLDVRDLVLVVNYDPPNHVEDYVHRVGRTGRAGNKGTAVTFISAEEDQYAPDLVRALKDSGSLIPEDLASMAEEFEKKRKAGLARGHGSGFGGSGYKFTAAEDDMFRSLQKAAARELGILEEDVDDGAFAVDGEEPGEQKRRQEQKDTTDGIREVDLQKAKSHAREPMDGGEHEEPIKAVEDSSQVSKISEEAQARLKAAQAMFEKLASGTPGTSTGPTSRVSSVHPVAIPHAVAPTLQEQRPVPPVQPSAPTSSNPVIAAAQAAAAAAAQRLGVAAPVMKTAGQGEQTTAPNIAAAAAAALKAMGVTASTPLPTPLQTEAPAAAPEPSKHFETELEINDFPQQARWKVTHRGTLSDISERYGAAIIVKGRYIKPGAPVPEGERKLFLHIAGKTADVVRGAKSEIKHILEETTEKAMRKDVPALGKYSL